MTEITEPEMTPEELADYAVELLNNFAEEFEKRMTRPPYKEELEYMREKVMLSLFGFYAREKVEDEEPKE